MEMPVKGFPNHMEYTAFTGQDPIGLQLPHAVCRLSIDSVWETVGLQHLLVIIGEAGTGLFFSPTLWAPIGAACLSAEMQKICQLIYKQVGKLPVEY